MLQRVFVRDCDGVRSMADSHPAEYWGAVRQLAEDNYDQLGSGQLTADEVRAWVNENWRPSFEVWDYDERRFVVADIPDGLWAEFVNDLIVAIAYVAERDAAWRAKHE